MNDIKSRTMNKSGDRGLTSAMRRISKEKPHAGGEGVVGVGGGEGPTLTEERAINKDTRIFNNTHCAAVRRRPLVYGTS